MSKRIFTWHIHGSYLYYLSQGNYQLYIPVRKEKDEGYYGLGQTFPFDKNVIEVPIEDIPDCRFDVILYQTDKNYLYDQYEILTPSQRKLPRIFLKHDPPVKHPVDANLVVEDPEVVIVHVTHFNRLMWNTTLPDVRVISHGVTDSAVKWTGELNKGIVVINNLPSRGRLLGLDIFNEVRKSIPLDLVGLGAEALGGYEVLHPNLPEFISHYRFFFNPIRYTSLGLAICEAMMAGMPVIGLATTELPSVIQNNVNGYIHTDPLMLVEKMKELLRNRSEAERIGLAARQTARSLFNIERFVEDWEKLFDEVLHGAKIIESERLLKPNEL